MKHIKRFLCSLDAFEIGAIVFSAAAISACVLILESVS